MLPRDVKSPTYKGTMVSIPVQEKVEENSGGWTAKLISSGKTNITVRISCPADVIVGLWTVEVDTKDLSDRTKSLRYVHPDPVYMLFNPWCQNDTVFLDNADKRQEYVMNESGMIWRGSHNRIRPCAWNYGQFEEDVLECSFHLLSHVGRLGVTSRANAVFVARHLSAVVNSPDDDGVIMGNWSGEYKGGEPPTKWTGSTALLQQFFKQKTPVKFGQCWVFAGVLTSVCRAIGLPARTVTNFSSAHDTHNGLTCDYFFDDEGEMIENLNSDSVWNFHVWNEVWMSRPDLDKKDYDGWQAIDATPQEESDGQYRCGPAPVEAVKRGDIKKGYDTPFLFAEVNADKVYWKYNGPTQPLRLIHKDLEGIGMNISTKAMGKMDREDITHQYKYPEKSSEEREVMFKALRECGTMYSRYYLNEDMEDIKFDFQLRDNIVIGSPFKVTLVVTNKSSTEEYNVNALLRVDTMLYTGKLKDLIKKDSYEINIKPASVEEVNLEVTFDDYGSRLEEQAAFNIAAKATVKETNFDYLAQDDFRVRMPDIQLEVEDSLVVGHEFKVHARLINPLPHALRKCRFQFEGPGINTPVEVRINDDVLPGAEIEADCTMTPVTDGEKTIVAKFHSKDLSDVDGHRSVIVLPGKGENETIN